MSKDNGGCPVFLPDWLESLHKHLEQGHALYEALALLAKQALVLGKWLSDTAHNPKVTWDTIAFVDLRVRYNVGESDGVEMTIHELRLPVASVMEVLVPLAKTLHTILGGLSTELSELDSLVAKIRESRNISRVTGLN